MLDDEVVIEVRKARETIAAKFGYDLKAIVEDARSRQGKDGRTVVPPTSDSEAA